MDIGSQGSPVRRVAVALTVLLPLLPQTLVPAGAQQS
ncbi:MAG: hypothetical protein RLZZ263_588, partial [Cyanobacteriota bacterium]